MCQIPRSKVDCRGSSWWSVGVLWWLEGFVCGEWFDFLGWDLVTW